MSKTFKHLLIILFISLIPTFLLWTPFFLRIRSFWSIPIPQNGMASIVANYDGPLYIAIAKTFYNKEAIQNFSFDLPSEYWAAHFPLYPLLIKIFAIITGYPYAMLIVTLLGSFLSSLFFYKFIGNHFDKRKAIWMVIVFSLLPARWLIVKSVGSPEPLYIACIIASLYYFKNQKYLLSGIWGSLATLIKPPGILIFVGFLGFLIFNQYQLTKTSQNLLKNIDLVKKAVPLLLIPLSLLVVFCTFQIRMNDFFAYFHSGDNIHLFFPPFQIFNYSAPWVGTFWLEEIIFVYLLGALGLMNLIQKKDYQTAWFVGVFFFVTLFISHRDLIRYSLPIFPFILYSFSETLITKKFKIAFLIIIIPVFLYSLTFISNNIMPISDWAPLL